MAESNNNARVFRLEIITPQKSVYSGDVESFTAPGSVGSFQILFNHAPFLSAIGTGEVRLQDRAGAESVYSTSGGFVEVSNNKASFLADTIEKKEEIDVERARASRMRAEERLSRKTPGTDVARATAALARAVNRLRVAGK